MIEYIYEYRFPDCPATYEDSEGALQPFCYHYWSPYHSYKTKWEMREIAEWLCYLCGHDLTGNQPPYKLKIEIREQSSETVRTFVCERKGYIATELTGELDVGI